MTQDVLKIRAGIISERANGYGLSKDVLIRLTEVGIVDDFISSIKKGESVHELYARLSVKLIGLCIGGIKKDEISNYLSLLKTCITYKVILKVVDGKLKFRELKLSL